MAAISSRRRLIQVDPWKQQPDDFVRSLSDRDS